jgi:hypothetical protein
MVHRCCSRNINGPSSWSGPGPTAAGSGANVSCRGTSQVILMLSTYHVFHFPRHGAEVYLRPGYEALILPRPMTTGRSHQAVLLSSVSGLWRVMPLG